MLPPAPPNVLAALGDFPPLAAQLLEIHFDGDTDDEVQECLRTIRHSVRNLLDLLGDLLNLSKIEAGIALAKIEEEFWASKTGQKLIRDRVERNFPEFISRAPAGMMNELSSKWTLCNPPLLFQVTVSLWLMTTLFGEN